MEKKMEKISGQKGIVEKIVQENDRQVERVLEELGFRDLAPKKIKRGAKLLNSPTAEQVYQALIDKVKKDDQKLFEHFHQPDFSTALGCRSLINATKELTNHLKGFYLKENKAKELLLLNPPKQIMANLGYGADIEKMLAQEDTFEIFCALRFVEDSRWLNDVFFKPYRALTRDDFEERAIKVLVLPERWTGIGQKFLGKKLHHMSHLKELGVVFIIPVAKRAIGETLYLFFMTLHYIYEVDWYSRLFEKYSREEDFAEKMVNALKVEVTGHPLPDKKKMSWRIVAKYLAKSDPNDPRLAEPHISPEAWHYTKTASAINKFARRFPETGLAFWQGLDAVGDYFPVNSSGEEKLISFDLFDNGISLLRQIGFESKYFYHQQEALWNKVFINYLGEEELDKIMVENLDKGYVTL